MDIFLLGGAGHFARNVLKDLIANLPEEWTVTLGDYEYRIVRKMAKKLGAPYRSRMVDLLDPLSFEKGATDSDLILSLAGPWYTTGRATTEIALQMKKPLVITATGINHLSREEEVRFLEKNISCITGASLLSGGIEILLKEWGGIFPDRPLFLTSVSVDTGKYGGLGFIREIFFFLSSPGKREGESDMDFSTFDPRGIFQKLAIVKRKGNSMIRTEILAAFQENLRKNPKKGGWEGISLVFKEKDRGEEYTVPGESLKGFLVALIRCAIFAAIEAPPGVHYLPEIYTQFDRNNLIGKQVEEISSLFQNPNS